MVHISYVLQRVVLVTVLLCPENNAYLIHSLLAFISPIILLMRTCSTTPSLELATQWVPNDSKIKHFHIGLTQMYS